jgi:hypothetical protein
MARKQKMVVDYFPHFVNDGKTIFILESKFGNDGYAFWFKVLEIIGKSPKHFFDCRDTYNLNFLLAKTRVEEQKAVEILDLLAGLNAIDLDLWKLKIIYSENFITNLDTVYSRRDTQPATKKEIIDNINDLSKVLMLTEIPLNEKNVDKSTQSKVKESKVNKRKEYNSETPELILSTSLYALIQKRNSKFKEPNLQDWCKHIDLMLRVDGRTKEEIEKVIQWCQHDDFWQNNILSTSKLRKQFDQLFMKMNGGKNGNTKGIGKIESSTGSDANRERFSDESLAKSKYHKP